MGIPSDSELAAAVRLIQEQITLVHRSRQDEATVRLPEPPGETEEVLAVLRTLLEALHERDQVSLLVEPDTLSDVAEILGDLAEELRFAKKIAGANGIEVHMGPGGAVVALAPPEELGDYLGPHIRGDGIWTGSESGGVKDEEFEAGSDGRPVAAHLTRPTDEADLTDMAEWYAGGTDDTKDSPPADGTPYIVVHKFTSDRDDNHHSDIEQVDDGYGANGAYYLTVSMNGWSDGGGGGADVKIGEVRDDSDGSVAPADTLHFDDLNYFSWNVTEDPAGSENALVAIDLDAQWLSGKVVGHDHWIDATWDAAADELRVTHDEPDADDPDAVSREFVSDIETEDDMSSWECGRIRVYYKNPTWDSRGHMLDETDWPGESDGWAFQYSV